MIKLWKPDENSRNVEEITILSEKREDILNQLNPIQYYKMEHHKISKLLNNLTVSKFVSRKWIQVDDLPANNFLSIKI